VGRYSKARGETRRPERHHRRTLPASPALEAPPMPERADGLDWTAEAERAWTAWWRSPMASAWIASDAVVVRRALRLVDDAERGRRGTDSALLALLDRLGLTPSGRHRLQWLIGPTEPAPAVKIAPRRDRARRGSRVPSARRLKVRS
jgi:hypothetical protein